MENKLNELTKAINNMVDWHIAAFQERDEKKQELYFTIYESKRKIYNDLLQEVKKEYGQ